MFSTSRVGLDLTRKFVQTQDGHYELESEHEAASTQRPPPSGRQRSGGGHKLLRGGPELRTFLKVGRMSPGRGSGTAAEAEMHPFTIEWIPDVLPTMRVGEMRITLVYGHQKNGREEVVMTTAATRDPDAARS